MSDKLTKNNLQGYNPIDDDADFDNEMSNQKSVYEPPLLPDSASSDEADQHDPNQFSLPSNIQVLNTGNQIGIQNNNFPTPSSSQARGSFIPPPLMRSDSGISIAFDWVSHKMAAGSVAGSVFTMVISIVGAGCLSLPYAIREAGFILGVFLLFFGGCLAYFTLDLLLISAQYLPPELRGPKPQRNISYQSLAQHSWGTKLNKASQFIMMIQYFGSMVSYIVAFSGLIDLVWSIYFDGSIYIYVAIGTSLVVILPLSLLRSINSLRFTSLLGFMGSSYLAIVVVIEYFALCNDSQIRGGINPSTCVWSSEFDLTAKELNPLDSFSDFMSGYLTAFPLFVFAYTGHMFLLPLYVELREPSIKKMRTVFRSGLSTILIIYAFVGIFGYLLFVSETCGNLLLNDFHKHIEVIIAALAISVSCILTEPIFSYNFRRMVAKLCWNQSTKQLSTVRHFTITFIFVVVNVALGSAVKSISIVFGFLGSTTYPTLGYIFPALFFLKITPKGKYKVRKVLAIIQMVFITLTSIASLIYKFGSPGDKKCDNAQSIG